VFIESDPVEISVMSGLMRWRFSRLGLEIGHLKLQFHRLIRHRNGAKENRDEICFLDLSHCLRIWADMKNDVQEFLNGNSANPCFENKRLDRRLANFLKGTNYTFIPIPGGSSTKVGSMGNICYFT